MKPTKKNLDMEKLPVVEKQHHFQFSEAPQDIFYGFKTAFSFPQHSKPTFIFIGTTYPQTISHNR